MNIVITSLYANPLHPGHVECLTLARQLGYKLIVIVNNDEQVKLKRDVPFMNQEDRMNIIRALRPVDEVVLSIDTDLTVRKTLEKVVLDVISYEANYDHIPSSFIFANGGYRGLNTPELEVCERLGIKIVNGIGEKLELLMIGSSSDLLSEYVKNVNDYSKMTWEQRCDKYRALDIKENS